VRVGAAVLIFKAIFVFGLVRTLILGVDDAIAVGVDHRRPGGRLWLLTAETESQSGEAAPVRGAVAFLQADAGAAEHLRAALDVVGEARERLERVLVEVGER